MLSLIAFLPLRAIAGYATLTWNGGTMTVGGGDLAPANVLSSVRQSTWTGDWTVKSTGEIRIMDAAFQNQIRLVSVDFGSATITSIPTDTFSGCTNLEQLILPSGIGLKIEGNPIRGCTKLYTSGIRGGGADAGLDGNFLCGYAENQPKGKIVALVPDNQNFDFHHIFVGSRDVGLNAFEGFENRISRVTVNASRTFATAVFEKIGNLEVRLVNPVRRPFVYSKDSFCNALGDVEDVKIFAGPDADPTMTVCGHALQIEDTEIDSRIFEPIKEKETLPIRSSKYLKPRPQETNSLSGILEGQQAIVYSMILNAVQVDMTVNDLTIHNYLELKEGARLTLGTQISHFKFGPDAKVVLVESNGASPRLILDSSASNLVKPASLELRLSNGELYDRDLVQGTAQFANVCNDWKDLMQVTGSSKPHIIECVGNSLKLRVPTPTPQPENQPTKKYWTDGRVAGVAVGSALGLAAIVGAILLVDHVQSKKKVRRVHPKSDRESQQQAKEETKSEEEELKVSPRQDLLDEAPLDPESDDE
jgi:hypothetical protein